jgi:hypothetical protein
MGSRNPPGTFCLLEMLDIPILSAPFIEIVSLWLGPKARLVIHSTTGTPCLYFLYDYSSSREIISSRSRSLPELSYRTRTIPVPVLY